MARQNKTRNFITYFFGTLICVLGSFSTNLEARTRISFAGEVKAYSKPESNERYHYMSVEKPTNSKLNGIWLRVSSDDRLLGYHFDWKGLPTSRELSLYSRDLPESIQKVRELQGNMRADDVVLASLANPSKTGFEFTTAADVITSISNNLISKKQRAELKEAWKNTYFGTEALSQEAAKAELEELEETSSETDVSSSTLIEELTSESTASGFNQWALHEIESRATFVAERFELFGSGRRRLKNSLYFVGFPDVRQLQTSFYWPAYLEELNKPEVHGSRGIERQIAEEIATESPLEDLKSPTNLRKGS